MNEDGDSSFNHAFPNDTAPAPAQDNSQSGKKYNLLLVGMLLFERNFVFFKSF